MVNEVLKNMNKTKKKCIYALLCLFVLMMTAASVNAEGTDEGVIPWTEETPADYSVLNDLTDDLLISPSPEPILIAPGTDVTYNEVLDYENASNDLTDELVISPNPEPSLIAPNSDAINEEAGETGDLVITDKTDEQSVISTMTIPAFMIIAIIVGITASILLIKRKE